jgi:hypothetical protein
MADLRVLTRREADIAACLLDTVVAAEPPLPAPARTDAVAALDRMLAGAPVPNRLGLRGLLWLAELAPLLGPGRRRLRRLSPGERDAALLRLERGPARQAVEALLAVVKFAYYGDGEVMRGLGYDADAVVARGRALRAAEGRW